MISFLDLVYGPAASVAPAGRDGFVEIHPNEGTPLAHSRPAGLRFPLETAMRLILTAMLLTYAGAARAEEKPRHQISFGNNLGLGWTAAASQSNADKSLGLDDFGVQLNDFGVNYAYRLSDYWQVGGAWAQLSDEQEIAFPDGEIETEVRQTHVFIFVTYNFHVNLYEAFYLTAFAGRQHFEHASNDKRASSRREIDVEYDLTTGGLAFGKRLSLGSWGASHVSYSPAISVWYGDASGDFGNDGLRELKSLRIDVLRFDVLF